MMTVRHQERCVKAIDASLATVREACKGIPPDTKVHAYVTASRIMLETALAEVLASPVIETREDHL